MSFRENLRRGRSHLITAAMLLATGLVVISIEDKELASKVGDRQALEHRQDVPARH
jgi:hypothetical protein